jgi:Flp pilus assembly protein TadD
MATCRKLQCRVALLFRLVLPCLGLTLCPAGRAATPVITYYKDIAPILLRHCAPCHRAGEAGGFSLLTYADARKRARLIGQVTQTRFMPPWLPEKGFGEFTDENRLSDPQIETIRRWVAAGSPEGSPADSPPVPVFTPGWQSGSPDLILTVSKPFSVPATGPDLFWNFVLTPAIARTRYVKSIEVRPGSARNIHHANLLVDRGRSARRREQEPGGGFPGMDLNIETTGFDPDSHFLFWKPGGRPWVEPPGLAWRLEPRDDLILNIHFHPTGKVESVQPSVGLYFTDEPPAQSPMLMKIENDSALNIAPGTRDFVVGDNFRLPVDVQAIAVYPHAHYLATLMEGYATLPDGSRRELIRIPQWDVNWQAVYHYREPLFLPEGSVVTMRFHYDNSTENLRNPNVPAKRVTAGDQATDEMGHLWLQLLTPGGADDRLVLQEGLMRHRLENDPSDPAAHFNLGSLLLSRQDYAGAVPHFRDALRFQPDAPLALNDLGVALRSLGQFAEAVGQFQHALRVEPGYISARFNLANLLAVQGKLSEAAAGYRQILAAEPSDTAARDQLFGLLVRMGDSAASEGRLGEAAECYGELVAGWPADADLHNNFGIILARSGDLQGAAGQFDAALRLNPLHATARRNLDAIRRRLEKH